MEKPTLKAILLETKLGKFKEVVHLLKHVPLDNEGAVYIIINCSHACTNEDIIDKLSCEDLSTLVDAIVECMNNLTDKHAKLYFQSSHFILKFFIRKKNYGLIAQKENMWLPTFYEKMDADCANLLKNMCKILHNLIVSLSPVEQESNKVLDLTLLTIKMNLRVDTTIKISEDYILYYLQNYKKYNIDVSEQCRNYTEVFQVLFTAKHSSSELMFNCSMVYLKPMMHNLLKQSGYKEVICILKKVLSGLRGLCTDIQHLALVKILASFRRIIFDINASELMNSLSTCYRDLKAFYEKHGLTISFQKTCMILNVVSVANNDYNKNMGAEWWNRTMTLDVQIIYYKLIGILYNFISKFESNCCNDCLVKTDQHSALTMALLVPYMLKTSILYNSNLPTKLINLALHYIDNCCIYVGQLKNVKCTSWKYHWSVVGTVFYNTGIQLYKKNNVKGIDFLLLFIKYVITYEGANDSIIKNNILSIAFECVCEWFLKVNEFKNVLCYAAVSITLNKNDRNDRFLQWIRCKCALKDNESQKDLQGLTLVQALRLYDGNLQHLLEDIDIGTSIELLIYEIKQYKSVWASKVPMISVCKEILLIGEHMVLVKMLVHCCMDEFLTSNSNMRELIDASMEYLRKSVSKKHDTVGKSELYVYLACLHFIEYNYCTTAIRRAILVEMGNAVYPLVPSLQPSEIHSDDECDMVTTYESLRLEKHSHIMAHLQDCLEILDTKVLLHENPHPTLTEVLKDVDICNILSKIAFEFRLHCFSFQMLHAWSLRLRYSRLLGDKSKALDSIGFILESANIECNDTTELLRESDVLASNLEDTPENIKTVTMLHVNKSMLYLRYNVVQNALKYFRLAKQSWAEVKADYKDELMEIRLDFLHTKFMMLPCDFEIVGHEMNPLAKLHNISNKTVEYKRKAPLSSFALSMVFEVSTAMVELYKCLRLPRELRCYSKLLTEISQEFVIPLRTGYSLVYLAYADIMCSRYDDSQVKINGVSDVLSVTTTSRNNNYIKAVANNNISSHTPLRIKHDLCDDFQEMMLDCPGTLHQFQACTGSPVFTKQPLQLPSFLNDSDQCTCFHCTSIEYQELILLKINLEAILLIYQGQLKVADGYLTAAERFYGLSSVKNRKYQEKISQKLKRNVVPTIEDNLTLAYCSVLLEHGNTCLRLNDEKRALRCNKELLALLDKIKYSNMYLYEEACIQKLNFIWPQTSTERGVNLRVPADAGCGEELAKTPESKLSVVTFAKLRTPQSLKPQKRVFKGLHFDLSDSEDNPTKSASTKFQTPKAVSLKKTAHKASARKKTANDTQLSVIPDSPEAHTPNSKKVYALKSMTNLLTTKLKSSAVKSTPVPNILVSNVEELDAVASQKSIRKNLMADLDEENKTVTRNSNKSSVQPKKNNNCKSGTKRITRSTRLN